MNVSLTRRPASRAERAALLRHPAMPAPAPVEQIRWVDPAELVHFAVHDGGTGEEDPERVQVNNMIRLSMAEHGFDPAKPPLLVLDRAAGRGVLKDGNHRTNFAADAGIALIPVRIREEEISPRFPHFPYGGQFDAAPATL